MGGEVTGCFLRGLTEKSDSLFLGTPIDVSSTEIREKNEAAGEGMIFHETKLKGVFLIDIEKFEDHRGFFARSFCQREFEKQGLVSTMVQANVSYNKKKGTLRGMHYQLAPKAETKLVRCVRGALSESWTAQTCSPGRRGPSC